MGGALGFGIRGTRGGNHVGGDAASSAGHFGAFAHFTALCDALACELLGLFTRNQTSRQAGAYKGIQQPILHRVYDDLQCR